MILCLQKPKASKQWQQQQQQRVRNKYYRIAYAEFYFFKKKQIFFFHIELSSYCRVTVRRRLISSSHAEMQASHSPLPGCELGYSGHRVTCVHRRVLGQPQYPWAHCLPHAFPVWTCESGAENWGGRKSHVIAIFILSIRQSTLWELRGAEWGKCTVIRTSFTR